MATTKVVDKEYLKNQFKNYNDQIINPQLDAIDVAVSKKVEKKDGYGLSKNDFTDELKAKLESLSNYDDSTLAEAINILNGDVTVEGSVAKTVADGIAAIVASAPDDFDTLKEISDWISGHAESASQMNSNINANTAAIAKLNSDENTTGSVANSIKEAVDALEYEIESEDIDFSTLEGEESTPEESTE